MATVQNNKIEFVIGDKAKISAADAYKLWFDTTHKQIILKGVEFIPKKLSELTNDSGFISSITKAMVEGVLTGTISSHTHAFSSLASKPTTISGYGITDAVSTSTLNSSLSNYLKLSGGTMTGILYANSAIIARGSGANKGYQGYFNNPNYALIGNGTHIFSSGKAQGNGALSFGQSSWAGVRNQDSDKDTYPYLAWQWMNTQPIKVNTTTSSVGGGTFYGYPLLGGEVVEYSTPDGGIFTYENTGQRLQFLLLVKNYDKFVFAGSATSSDPRNIVCYMFGGMYVLRSPIIKVTERVIGDTTYYEVIIHQGSSTALDYTKYNPSNQIQLLCATKCNADNFSGADNYISGNSSIAMNYDCKAFGSYSIALGMQSIATSFCSNAIGYFSVAANAYSAAFGVNSYALGNNSFAFGSSSVAKAYMSATFGELSVTLGNYSMAFGRRSVTKGENSMAFGYMSQASGYASMAFGYQSTTAADRTMAFGAYSTCTKVDSMNFALYGISNHSFQTVFGKYNKTEDAALIVGGGTGTADADRKNIFKVDWSGNVTGKSFSGYSNSVGGEGFKIYPENSNQINFGGTSSTDTIYFGYRSLDSRPTPTKYVFGANGTAKIKGGVTSFYRNYEKNNCDANVYTDGILHNHGSSAYWKNAPQGMSYGSILTLKSHREEPLSGQLAWDVNQDSTTDTTRYLWWRATDAGDWIEAKWHQIAFTDSNVATATKLKTPRTLWGKSFDGSGNIDGSITLSTATIALGQSRGIKNTSSSGFIGYTDKNAMAGPDGEIVGDAFTGISLGWGAEPETDSASVRINDTTFTYKSYPILHSNNFSDYAPTKTGEGASGTWGISISGNANTASQLATPRTLTIGNTGKTFDGTADVSWSLDEIGVKDENVKFTTSADNVDYRLTAIGQRMAGNVEGVNGVVTAEGITMNPGTGNLKATSFTGSLIGNADTATALTSSAGSSTQPIYFSNGKPVACSYTLAKSVPSNAVFTDTTYSVATAAADGLMSAAMFKAQMVKSVGVQQGEAMMNPDGTITITDHSVYITQNKSNITGVYQTAIGDNDVQIPNATTDYDGSMSYTDKRKITNIQDGCIAASVYVMNINYDTLNNLDGVEYPIMDFANLNDIMTSGNFPDMIRLVLNNSIHVFTLYESYLSGKNAQYRCEGRKAEISILVNNYVSFSVN